jgi:hypothetical protein
MNKLGITKGGQTVLLVDAYRGRPYAYVHRHKCHVGYPGWTIQGQLEVRLAMEAIAPFVEGKGSGHRLWKEKPHTTWDNHFSGCRILDWLGNEGFAATMTCRRDRLPSGVPKKYFHWDGTPAGNKRAKVARFLNPIIAVKISKRFGVPEPSNSPTDYVTRVHVSMQSTSSTNFTTVNALNAMGNYISRKERGREANGSKQSWGIEMNDARELYLKTYGAVDTLDSMIRRCEIGYRSFLYWHSPKNHALAMAVSVSHDMHKECMTEASAHEHWKFTEEERRKAKKEFLTFYAFRDKLSIEGCEYDPIRLHYPGDKFFREVTALTRDQRERKKNKLDGTRTVAKSGSILTKEQYNELKRKECLISSRFCGDLTKLILQLKNH